MLFRSLLRQPRFVLSKIFCSIIVSGLKLKFSEFFKHDCDSWKAMFRNKKGFDLTSSCYPVFFIIDYNFRVC